MVKLATSKVEIHIVRYGMKKIEIFTRGLSLVGGIAIFLMMILTAFDVAGKYIFNVPIPGAAEVIASYFMIAAVFLPIADTEIRGESIAVDLLYEKVSISIRMLFNLLAFILAIVFYGVLAYQNLFVAMDSYLSGEYVSGTWDVIIWPSKFLIPLGLLAALLAIVHLLVNIKKASSSHEQIKDPV